MMRTLYIAMEDALLIAKQQAQDVTQDWQLAGRLEGLPTYALAVDPYHPERMYCSTFGKGLWRSNDSGDTWTPVGAGIRSPEVMAVAVSEASRSGKYGVVWAGTEPSALFHSEDGGESWIEHRSLQAIPSRTTLPWSFPPRPYTHHVRWIEPDPITPNRLFVAIEQGGVMRSLDGGSSWEDHKAGAQIDGHTLATHKLAPGRVYEAAGGTGLVFSTDDQERKFPILTRGGYAETRDGGGTWETQTGGLEQHHYFWSLAVDPADPDVMVMSGGLGPQHVHFPVLAESYLYRRTANTPWQMVTEGLPEPKGTIAHILKTHEEEPGVFYAASGRGVYRSADQGQTWQRLGITIPAHYRWQRTYGLIVR
jgi:hypothetical protein